jgi:hypothetical protein
MSDDPAYLNTLEPIFEGLAQGSGARPMTPPAAILAADVVCYSRLMGDHSVRLSRLRQAGMRK